MLLYLCKFTKLQEKIPLFKLQKLAVFVEIGAQFPDRNMAMVRKTREKENRGNANNIRDAADTQ